jgi:putative FmdB family regulatory protein
MPHYDYVCGNCDHKLCDVYQSIKDKPLLKCTACNKKSLERVIYAPLSFTRKEPTTIGQLAERNSKRLGRAEISERESKDRESKKSAMDSAKKEVFKKINKMNDEQKRAYIENG